MKLIMESWRKFVLRESQFADTAAEEAEKINSQAGIQLNTSQEYWEQMGVSTGEQLAIALLTQTYSDMHKSLHGRRPYGQFYSVEAVQSAIEDLDKQAEAMIEQDKLDAQAEAEYQEKKAELQALMPDEYDTEYEKMPQQMGMGRAAGLREDELEEGLVDWLMELAQEVTDASLNVNDPTRVYDYLMKNPDERQNAVDYVAGKKDERGDDEL